MSDFIFDHFGWVLVGILVIFGAGTCAVARSADEKREWFMTECVADGQKRYKCEVMYDGAQPAHVNNYPIVVHQ